MTHDVLDPSRATRSSRNGDNLVRMDWFWRLPLGFEREATIIAALVSLAVAGAIVALGAVVLFRRERRLRPPVLGREENVEPGREASPPG